MNKAKKFLLINEQINHLIKERKLKIIDIKKLRYYLSKFNYQQLINGYNDYLMVNFDRRTNRYLSCVNSQHIIDIYEFDKQLQSIFIKDILSIESAFASEIAYQIMKNNQNIKWIKTGQILKCNKKELLIIFPGLKKCNFKFNKEFDSNYLDENIEILKKCLLGFINKDHKIVMNMNLDEVPLWKLSIFWSFRETIKIFSVLPINIKNFIISSFTKSKKRWNNAHIHFEKTMVMLNDFRNLLCHDNVLYNFLYDDSKNNKLTNINIFYNKIMNKNKLESSPINLKEIIQIIIFFSYNRIKTANKIEFSLKKEFDKLKKRLPEIVYKRILMNLK